jgi:polyhydroxyalkanoate synthesis regulator phasin
MKRAVHAIRRFLEALDAALDLDPYQEVRLRVERLEQQVADLNARMLA